MLLFFSRDRADGRRSAIPIDAGARHGTRGANGVG
jgi:hypothetical protein